MLNQLKNYDKLNNDLRRLLKYKDFYTWRKRILNSLLFVFMFFDIRSL